MQGIEMCEAEFQEEFEGVEVLERYDVEFVSMKGDAWRGWRCCTGISRV